MTETPLHQPLNNCTKQNSITHEASPLDIAQMSNGIHEMDLLSCAEICTDCVNNTK